MTRIAHDARLIRVGEQDRWPSRQQRGAWLRQQRERRGFTATELAQRLGVHQSRVSSYELGQNAVDDQRAQQIAEILDLPLLTVRRNLGLWVPADDGTAPSVVEAIHADPGLDPEIRLWLVEQYEIALELTQARAAEAAGKPTDE